MKKQIRPLFLFICIIAFAFAFGLASSENVAAGPGGCCSFQPPGCGVSHGTWNYQFSFCDCVTFNPMWPNCTLFCASCG